MGTNEVRRILDEKPAMRELLFSRGFLLTEAEVASECYPFWNIWSKQKIGNLTLLVHPKQTWYACTESDCTMLLVGHAYDPVLMMSDENIILQRLINEYINDNGHWLDLFNELTGVFTLFVFNKKETLLFGDCAGMQSTYYGYVDGKLFVSSHMQLIADICRLRRSPYVDRLIGYRFYHYYGAFLPGNISAFDELKRLVPNTYVCCCDSIARIVRFYPTRPLRMVENESEYQDVVKEIAQFMHNTMVLISEKWKKPAVSMTGGVDSKLTVAAIQGLYDSFSFFSYNSSMGEKIDCDAASKIADNVGIMHKVHDIPKEMPVDVFEDIHQIICHNYGNIGRRNKNDVNKRMFYLNDFQHDIEVKSWVSEIGRANYYKKFGRTKMPRMLTPRMMSSMYKVFLHDRKLLRDTDRVFLEYIEQTSFTDIFNYDASDMYLWEFRYGSWGGQVITAEHRVSFDITIPYNNRKLLELFLSAPLKKRISDELHQDITNLLNEKVNELGITITNYNETKQRMIVEKLYFALNSVVPF